MASKVTAKTNSLRGGVHHFLRAAHLQHQSCMYHPYKQIQQQFGGNMALSDVLQIAGPWQGWQHNACVQCTSGYPRTPISGSLQECKGGVTHTSTLTECWLQRLANPQLVNRAGMQSVITCPACQGTPGPSDPAVHSHTNLSLQRANCRLCCYVMSHGNRNVTACWQAASNFREATTPHGGDRQARGSTLPTCANSKATAPGPYRELLTRFCSQHEVLSCPLAALLRRNTMAHITQIKRKCEGIERRAESASHLGIFDSISHAVWRLPGRLTICGTAAKPRSQSFSAREMSISCKGGREQTW
jgi:hypothetical protein